MRRFITVVVLVLVVVCAYLYRHKGASDAVKQELMQIAEDMELSPEWTEEVQAMIRRFHDQAFAEAMDVSKRLGRKFDEELYYNQILDSIIACARETGRGELADKLAEQREQHRLTVTER